MNPWDYLFLVEKIDLTQEVWLRVVPKMYYFLMDHEGKFPRMEVGQRWVGFHGIGKLPSKALLR